MTGPSITMTDGGLETTLILDEGLDLPGFAAFPLLETEAGRAALERYFAPFLELARERDLAFVMDTVTWRASPDWGRELGYDPDALAAANRDAVAFARTLAESLPRALINGIVGPRGDGYVVGERMTAEAATTYHAWQIGRLADAGVDRVTAMTMTYPEEVIGVVGAAADAGVAVVASFTVGTDGRLPDGTGLAEAINRVDMETDGAAAFFMVNCAHPDHIAAGLGAASALSRIGGLRVNASKLSHAELDAAEAIDQGNPAELGSDHAQLRSLLPGVRLLGGCCGTDLRHVTEIIDRWDA